MRVDQVNVSGRHQKSGHNQGFDAVSVSYRIQRAEKQKQRWDEGNGADHFHQRVIVSVKTKERVMVKIGVEPVGQRRPE